MDRVFLYNYYRREKVVVQLNASIFQVTTLFLHLCSREKRLVAAAEQQKVMKGLTPIKYMCKDITL